MSIDVIKSIIEELTYKSFITQFAIMFIIFVACVILMKSDKFIRHISRRKKRLNPVLQLFGIFLAVRLATMGYETANAIVRFNGTECGERHSVLKTLTTLDTVSVDTEEISLFTTLDEKLAQVVGEIDGRLDTKYINISFKDMLKNKDTVKLENIHEVSYSDTLDADEIQIVKYVVNTEDGEYRMPWMYYRIVLSESIQDEVEAKIAKLEKKAAADMDSIVEEK